jgi:hypothetical protein
MELNPAGRLRAPVRQRLDSGDSRRAHEAEPQHLDSLVSELEGLRKQLGAGDVRTVNQYTDEIREIERTHSARRQALERSA